MLRDVISTIHQTAQNGQATHYAFLHVPPAPRRPIQAEVQEGCSEAKIAYFVPVATKDGI